MRVLVNGLSIGSLSGRHVLYGHLRELVAWGAGTHEFHVLHAPGERPPVELQRDHVHWLEAPAAALRWTTRAMWEAWGVPRLIRAHRCELYFTPSGTVLPRSPVPQVSLAQNPWCLMPGIPRGAAQQAKAWLQRKAYRSALRRADLMFFNSRHMRDLYQRNNDGALPATARIAYQGIQEATFAAARTLESLIERRACSIVSVSTMARWKGAETVVRAVALLRQRGIPATYRLVGSWPDREYERLVRAEIVRLGLEDVVSFAGEVSVDDLHHEYASATVFCLMSGCESFGIPAVEAQAFGTPVVGSNVCAMPEIGGVGGVYGPPGDPAATARLLEPLLTDVDVWRTMSARARDNAERFHWDVCSRPLREMFGAAVAETVAA